MKTRLLISGSKVRILVRPPLPSSRGGSMARRCGTVRAVARAALEARAQRQHSGVALRRILRVELAIVLGDERHRYAVRHEAEARDRADAEDAQPAGAVDRAGATVVADLLRVIAGDAELEPRREHLAGRGVDVDDVAGLVVRVGVVRAHGVKR